MSEEFFKRRAAGVFPKEMISRLVSIYQTLITADWTDPNGIAQQLFEAMAKYDYQAIYSKFMTACVLFWLTPNKVRQGKITLNDEEYIKIKKDTEHTFDVLWLAYERWMFRGSGHVLEVATHLNSFYSELRWAMALQRTSEGIPADVQKKIAEEAYHYLVQVRSLVKRSYNLFEDEVEPMLNKLVEKNPNIG